MKITKKFGLRVKEIRLDKGLTQEILAELSGISRQYIGDVERGERNISLINIQKIADALNINLNELFDFR